ncbi:hypothetical protein SNE40_020953 [Patella caerulea]|uniref:Uncharacterized protein n=1 Tax=Patella caerulea TaxID=87958 RepID=A0AAN8GH61_PATCE
MSSGEALVESGCTPVKASCLSFKLKLLIGLAVGTVVVSGAVSAGVLLSNNTNNSVDAVLNATTADNTANGTQTSFRTTVDSLTNEYETTNTPNNDQTLAFETDITPVHRDSSSTVTPNPLNNETLSQMTKVITTNSNKSLGTTTAVLGGTATKLGTAPGLPGATQTMTAANAVTFPITPSTNTGLMRATTPPTTPPPTTELLTTVTPPLCPASRNRTAILMFYDGSGDLFLRGGPIDITHLSLGPGFATYNQQASTNTELSWNHNSPTAKTSNDVSSSIYHSLNTYGDNYWLMDVCMVCSANERFGIKGFTNDWESDRNQDGSCSGSADATTIASSTNHQGICGKINVFKFNENMCTIDNF